MTTEAHQPEKLTPKREKFCFEYLKDLNGTAAAKRAGYAHKGAYREGNRLLGFAVVQDEIARLRLALQSRTEVTPEKIVRELASIAFADLGEVMHFGEGDHAEWDFSQLPPEFSRAIQSVKVERFTEGRNSRANSVKSVNVKMHDKHAALVDLAKIYGMMREAVDVNITSNHDSAELADATDDDLRGFINQRQLARGQRGVSGGATANNDEPTVTTARVLTHDSDEQEYPIEERD